MHPRVVLGVVSAATFLIAGALFVLTSLRRRRLDSMLRMYRPRGEQGKVRKLGLFGPWTPEMPVALAEPERRWTYDKDYLVEFLRTLYLGSGAEAKPTDGLAFYRTAVLPLDIAFAIAFSVFLALTSLLMTGLLSLWPWVTRLALSAAAVAILYGVADVSEDLKLVSILRHAERVFGLPTGEDAPETASALVDAAEADAANTLTRIKLLTITVSIILLVIFLLLWAGARTGY